MDNVLITAGIACLIAAIVGGGLKAFGNEFPPLASLTRQLLLGALGAVLLGLGLGDRLPGFGREAPVPAPEANRIDGAPANQSMTTNQAVAEGDPGCQSDAAPTAQRLVNYLDRYQPDPATGALSEAGQIKLLRIAVALGVTSSGSREEVYDAILDRVLSAGQEPCPALGLERMIGAVQQASGDAF